jgi:hypothetical protein
VAVKFEFDPEFDQNVYRASNKSRSSLRPLYDLVRKVTDEVAKNAKSEMLSEWIGASAELKGANKFTKGGDFQTVKARAFALKSAHDSTFPTMGFDGREIYGRVTINRKGSQAIEFGGADIVAEIGKGTGNYLTHPAYAFLRRALDKSGG